MKLYLLNIIKDAGYDAVSGFVIRAPNPKAARELAAEKAGGEGADTWLSHTESSCKPLKPDGHTGIVLRDFRAG